MRKKRAKRLTFSLFSGFISVNLLKNSIVTIEIIEKKRDAAPATRTISLRLGLDLRKGGFAASSIVTVEPSR